MPTESSWEGLFSLHLGILSGKEKRNRKQHLQSLILTEIILWWCHPQPSFVLYSENIVSYAKAGEIIESSQWYSIEQLACECSAETQQRIILES